MIKVDKKYILTAVCMLIFVLITFPYMITHIPHCDESQNYMAAHFMTLSNFFEISASHGHPILWWLVILPFAKLHVAYPYPMLIINYLFLISALIVMWIKAPFNNVLKIIITFSFMMVSYFALVARCYTIGILGLFILMCLYKDRLKRPVLYSIILGLTANTSAIACIGILGLSLMFVFDLFKDRKSIKKSSLIISLIILFSFGLFYLYPFFNYHFHVIAEKESFEMFYFPLKNNLTFIVAYVLAYIFLIFNGFKNKCPQSVFFLIFTTIAQLLFMTFVYCCFQHHNYFFLIYMIMTIWMQNSYKPYEGNLCSYLYVLMALMLFTPNDLTFKHGSPVVLEYGKQLEKDSSMFDNSVILFADNPDDILFQLAPFLINNKSVTLINGTEPYSYVMKWFIPTNEDIQRISDSFDKPFYVIVGQHTDLPQYYLVENIQDKIKIYRVK